MEIIATLEETSPVVEGVSQKTGNPWKKTEVVISTGGDWPRKIALQAFNETCDKARAIRPGSAVKVRFDISARKWEKDGRSGWQNDITLRSIYNLEQQPSVASPAHPGQPYASQPNTATPPLVTETPTGEFQF
ncbi:MAG: DUF3127 domain-containing protein [Bacteroidales bacterium]|nr:DUF3127 domain-containing protein [Bacteroidales bacterium]